MKTVGEIEEEAGAAAASLAQGNYEVRHLLYLHSPRSHTHLQHEYELGCISALSLRSNVFSGISQNRN